ncbi:Dcp1p-Dcp2p decapping enzyme complex alpha subunit [Ascosphaera atra]|nr:Dcp1p-Dcp2p decapping enzyme complex alpha subunit [Ascosphaera atra]
MDSKTASLFPTGKPRETVLDTVICKHCKKPVLRVNAAEHIRGCMKAKQEKQRKKKEARDLANRLKYGDKEDDTKKKTSLTGKDDDEDDHHHPSSALTGQKATKKSTAADDVAGNKKGKKRKADAAAADDASQADAKDPAATTGPGKKKKKKDEPAHPPKKPAKSKGPVDVERQCGVTLPNGGQCARSLTCKSHSMGAKRAVPGRSLPYDMLLQAYQKKNQARQQKAAIDANAPVVDDEDARAGKVDSDEEKERCMRGIERMWAGRKSQALVSHRLVGTRYKYRMVRVRDMFAQALGGAGLFAGAAGSPGAEPHGHAHTSQEGNAMFSGFGLGLFGSGLGSGRIFGPDPVVLNDGQNSTAQQHAQPPAPGAASAASPNPSSANGLPHAHTNLPSPATPGAGHAATANGGSRGGTPTTTAGPGHAAGGGGGGGSTSGATANANANAKRNSSVSMSMSQQAQVNAAAAAAAAAAGGGGGA